jgi:hypothetical protein
VDDLDGATVYTAASVKIALEFCAEFAAATLAADPTRVLTLLDFRAPMLEEFHFSFTMMWTQLRLKVIMTRAAKLSAAANTRGVNTLAKAKIQPATIVLSSDDDLDDDLNRVTASRGKVKELPTRGKVKQPPTREGGVKSIDYGSDDDDNDRKPAASRPTSGKVKEPPTHGKVKELPTHGKVKEPPTHGKVRQPPTRGKAGGVKSIDYGSDDNDNYDDRKAAATCPTRGNGAVKSINMGDYGSDDDDDYDDHKPAGSNGAVKSINMGDHGSDNNNYYDDHKPAASHPTRGNGNGAVKSINMGDYGSDSDDKDDYNDPKPAASGRNRTAKY